MFHQRLARYLDSTQKANVMPSLDTVRSCETQHKRGWAARERNPAKIAYLERAARFRRSGLMTQEVAF